MSSLGLTMTGVIIHVRTTGKDLGFHEDCAQKMMDLQSKVAEDAGMDAWQAMENRVLVEVGPLFADPSQWLCAYIPCDHQNEVTGE